MVQRDFFKEEETPKAKARARRTDPETSHEAAASVTELGKKQAAVLAVVRRLKQCTDVQLVERYMLPEDSDELFVSQSISGIRTRRAELVRKGLVRFTGRYGTTDRGRRTRVWEVVT